VSRTLYGFEAGILEEMVSRVGKYLILLGKLAERRGYYNRKVN
jgi:hypothetical protein